MILQNSLSRRWSPRFTDGSNSQLLKKSLIGESIRASFTDWGYLDLAIVVHLYVT